MLQGEKSADYKNKDEGTQKSNNLRVNILDQRKHFQISQLMKDKYIMYSFHSINKASRQNLDTYEKKLFIQYKKEFQFFDFPKK